MRLIRQPLLYFLLLVLGLTACSPGPVELVGETDEKQYQRGKLYLRNGRTEDALSAFLGVIDSRRDAPESHLEAGVIFLQEIRDPVRAYYHFSRYLESKPDSERSPQVRELLETAQKNFAQQLPAQPFEGQLDRIDLMDLIKNLRFENESLKADLMGAQNRVRQLEGMIGQARRIPSAQQMPIGTARSSTGGSGRTDLPPLPEGETAPRTYTVQSGDSLSGISRKIYGTSTRWTDIYQANRDLISSENDLRVGQELRIP
mgnify:CR=1 FL=1